MLRHKLNMKQRKEKKRNHISIVTEHYQTGILGKYVDKKSNSDLDRII